MKICIISSIFHGFGKIGGYGAMARQLAEALNDLGHEVIVVVPRRTGQGKLTCLKGIRIIGAGMAGMLNPFLYKKLGADIYHSQSPNLMSAAAMLGAPDNKHVITCRDPRNWHDWMIELRDATWKRRIRNIFLAFFEEGPVVAWAIKRADAVGYAAGDVRNKVMKMYKPAREPYYLPNIEMIACKNPEKNKYPTVCFAGRLDRRKRPELFFELAGKFPHVHFLVMGRAEDANRQKMMEDIAKKYSNIHMLGYIDKFDEQERFYETYEKSWILINTASREAFPLTFFEAGGRKCAILARVNPDNFVAECGYCAEKNNFEEGLSFLLENNRWKEKGRRAYEYVRKSSEYDRALNAHLQLYHKVLSTH